MLNLCKKWMYLVVCVLLFSCSRDVEVRKIATEDFFKDLDKSTFQISPDGLFLSYLQPSQGKLNIFIQSIANGKVSQVTNYADESVKNYFWASNDKLFYMKEKDSTELYQMFSINKDGSQKNKIQTAAKSRIEIIDQVKRDEQFVLISTNERIPENFDVYRLNINSGKKSMLIKNPGNMVDWIADHDGKVRLAIGSDGVNESIYYRESEENDFKIVISNNFKNSLKPLGFTKQKNHIYALSNLNRDKLALVDFDCTTGKEVKVIYENVNADVADVVYSKSTQQLAYLTYEIVKREVYYLNNQVKVMMEEVQKQVPNQEIKIIDKDQNESRFIVRTYTDKNPGSTYLYTVKDKSLIKLADLNSAIKPDEMCEMKPITYKSKDGLTIHGYLTLPIGKKAKNLPCVVIPHQGPSTRNIWAYNAEVQFLANRGYAVFQMNYRGSTGYGKAFQTAGFKQWGGKLQDDITDGVKWLIDEGIVNEERIAIYGFSFGGYAALNQIIYHPNLYQCAISYSGFINLFTYLKGFPAYYKPYQQMLGEMIGDPEQDSDYLKSASPIFQIDKIKKPLLIAQGVKDARVNVNETNQFVKELKKRKVNVNYILKENESHYFKEPKNRLEFYKNLETFLDKYLNPDK